MNVTVADPFGQIVESEVIVTIGNCTTVITIDPVWGWLQPGVPVVATLTNVNVVLVA